MTQSEGLGRVKTDRIRGSFLEPVPAQAVDATLALSCALAVRTVMPEVASSSLVARHDVWLAG